MSPAEYNLVKMVKMMVMEKMMTESAGGRCGGVGTTPMRHKRSRILKLGPTRDDKDFIVKCPTDDLCIVICISKSK